MGSVAFGWGCLSWSPQAAGADIGWHFPVPTGREVDDWNLDKYWVLYSEPIAAELWSALHEGDRKDRQKYGYVIRPERPATQEEMAQWTWGVGKERKVKKETRGRSSARERRSASQSPGRTRSPPRWKTEPSP